LDDNAIVVGFRIITNGTKITKTDKPIRRWCNLDHAANEWILKGNVDRGQVLRFGSVVHALANYQLQGFETGIGKLVGNDRRKALLSNNIIIP
jgi:hypothetical protein